MAQGQLDCYTRWQTLSAWWQSPVGLLLSETERPVLEQALAPLFGSYLLQCSAHLEPLPHADNIRYNVPIGPLGPSIRFEECAWPIVPQSVDAVLLHHMLEFAQNPHQLLREAALTVRPGGHLLIMGLNPWSSWGLSGLIGQEMLKKARMLPAHRVHDWLKLLGFSVEKRKVGCYRPPLASHSWQEKLNWLDQLGERWQAPCGGFYLLVARKLTLGMRMPKPVKRHSLGQLLPAPAVKLSARTTDKPCKRSKQ